VKAYKRGRKSGRAGAFRDSGTGKGTTFRGKKKMKKIERGVLINQVAWWSLLPISKGLTLKKNQREKCLEWFLTGGHRKERKNSKRFQVDPGYYQQGVRMIRGGCSLR